MSEPRPSVAARPSGMALRRALPALPARLLGGVIWLYQQLVSPALVVVAGPHCGCRFHPTCSHYARTALHEHGLFAGLALTARRLGKCGPWHPGGLDPVPPARRFACTAARPGA